MKTKKKLLFTAALGLLLSLAGCITSLHPLYTPDTIRFRGELLGDWAEVDGDDQWHFERVKDENAYWLSFSDSPSPADKAESETYKVHLVQLENYFFLDFYGEPDEEKNQKFSLAQRIPSHGFARIDFLDGQVKLRLFDYDWLEQLFRERKIRLQHELLDDNTIVLTAPSAELQKFVIKYAEDERAYIEPIILRRSPN